MKGGKVSLQDRRNISTPKLDGCSETRTSITPRDIEVKSPERAESGSKVK